MGHKDRSERNAYGRAWYREKMLDPAYAEKRRQYARTRLSDPDKRERSKEYKRRPDIRARENERQRKELAASPVLRAKRLEKNKQWREDRHLKELANPDLKVARNEKNRAYLRGSRHPRVVSVAKARAKKRGRAFDLTVDYIKSIWPADNRCPILGTVFTVGGDAPSTNASIDEIIVGRGYVRGNVAIISYRANRVKNDASLAEIELLATWMRRVCGSELMLEIA